MNEVEKEHKRKKCELPTAKSLLEGKKEGIGILLFGGGIIGMRLSVSDRLH